MAYAFEDGESVPTAVARIMNEQIVRARSELTDASLASEKRVHEARKRFKETRALIRLVREPLGSQYAVENAWFRDAGRELAGARDADAVLEALQKLELPRAVERRARKALQTSRAARPPLEPIIENVVAQLALPHARVGMWPELADGFESLEGGLLRTYVDGRRESRRALKRRDPAALHEWRKRVKEHWYHGQLLRNVWPEMMKPYAQVLSRLSHTLGDHHDLHVLQESIPDPPPALVEAIGQRQRALEEEAESIGRRVYADKPQVWLARMRNLWSAWRPS